MMNFKDRLTLWLDHWAIADWRKAWGKYSVKFDAILVLGAGLWFALPVEVQSSILAAAGVPTSWIVACIAIISFILKMKSQTPKE